MEGIVWSPPRIRGQMRMTLASLHQPQPQKFLLQEKWTSAFPACPSGCEGRAASPLPGWHTRALGPACGAVWACEPSTFILLPPAPCYRKEHCCTSSLLLHRLQGRKYFYAIKILLVFSTPSSSMQNRKAWHIAFYGYKRSRWRFFVFSDNCARNINTTLS